MKSNREQDTIKRKNKEIRSEVRATTLRPHLHYYEGFYYPLRDLPQIQRDYNLVYIRPEYTTPPNQPSTQEVSQSQLRL